MVFATRRISSPSPSRGERTMSSVPSRKVTLRGEICPIDLRLSPTDLRDVADLGADLAEPGFLHQQVHRRRDVVAVKRLVKVDRELRQHRVEDVAVAGLDRVDEAEEPSG